MAYEQLKNALRAGGREQDLPLVDKAYQLAAKSHEGQHRNTGEPYIDHPLQVALLLVDLGMDAPSLCAALLHDVVEDTVVSMEDIRAQFGEEIANLVDGVTKLGKITFSSVEEQQAENVRKMLLAMSKDVRVMIVKLCDRLHNMRTAAGWAPQKRRDKARETMEVYAPVAHRMGMNAIKEELEDLSLGILDPIGYAEIRQSLDRDGDAEHYVETIAAQIKAKLAENGLEDAFLESRVKSVAGIYRKVFIQGRDIDEIYDIYAIRIIVNTVAECYAALGVIHDLYHPIPNRFKDYISMPKANMYQSLHTSVIGAGTENPFEIQIRTWTMHRSAEYGVAAHWKYKEGILGSDEKLEQRLAWVRQLLENQKENPDTTSILSDIKSDLLPEDVFVFTPKGDVINLPAGATVIDFAYAIHSAVGNRMMGAKANGRIVPLTYKVTTGEIIEVLTGPEDKGPSRDWLSIVTTGQAKSKIRNWFKKERREENITEGKSALEREMRRNLINVPESELPAFMEEIAKRQHLNTAEELYAAIGYGGVLLSRVMTKVKEQWAKIKKPAVPILPTELPDVVIKGAKSNDGVIVEGLDNCLIKFSRCCNPLPGDDIVGFVTRGYGVSIHKRDCKNVHLEDNDPDNASRWVRAYWAKEQKADFKSTLEILAFDKQSIFADVSTAIANMRVPIFALNAKQTQDGKLSMSITVGIQNTEHLNGVIAKLKKIKDVVSITRS